MAEGQLAEPTDGDHLARRDHVVVGLVLLEHEPHRLDVVAGVAPVALRVEVAEVELLLHAQLDAPDGAGDLAGDECLAAAGRFVVEEDAAAGVHVVRLAVVDRRPVREDLRDAVRRARVEGRLLGLRHLLHLAEHLRTARLVVADLVAGLVLVVADRLEKLEARRSPPCPPCRSAVEAHAHVALRAEVVHLGRLHPAR